MCYELTKGPERKERFDSLTRVPWRLPSFPISENKLTLESLSNNDGDGFENVPLKKVNSRCFKLYRAYSISLNS